MNYKFKEIEVFFINSEKIVKIYSKPSNGDFVVAVDKLNDFLNLKSDENILNIIRNEEAMPTNIKVKVLRYKNDNSR